jgi:hypothetical protein
VNRLILTVGGALALGLGLIIAYSIMAETCQDLAIVYGISTFDAIAGGRDINCYV